MQRCPKCNRTYQDDKQKFCTHDGGRLEPYAPPLNEAPTSFDLGATMRTDSSDLGETLLDKAAELNKTMAAPPPPPPSPQLSKTIAVPSPPKVTPAAAAPPPPPPQPPPSQPPQNKTVAAPPPQSPPAGGIRPTGTMPGSSQTSELPRPQETTGFPPPASGVSQPSGWPPAPPPPATASTPHRQPVAPPLAPGHITQPVQKPNRLPLVIGGIVVLLLLAVGASVIAYMMYSRKSEPKPTNEPGLTSNISTDKKDVTNANANTAGNANSSTSKFEAPPNSLKFVNSRADLDGKLAEHYADFSFYYPRLWTLDPKSGVPGASNFVKVDRIVPPDFKQESFAVGWYDSKGMMTADRAIFPNLVSRFSNSLAGSFPNYEKVSEGDTEINSYKGYEFRFKSVAEGTDRGDVTVWGRVIFLPPEVEGSKNGLVLLMFTTSVAADLGGVEEVGKKGELAMIIDTFKLGANP